MDKTWEIRIKEADKRGYFTEEDIQLANYFTTCAISERINPKLYEHDLTKMSNKAFQLGLDFGYAIKHQNMEEILKTYNNIIKLTPEDIIHG